MTGVLDAMREDTVTSGFTEFVAEHERRLRNALIAMFGSESGRDATAEAFAYAWEHWDRVSAMDNPGAYLFVVGRDRGRRMRKRRQVDLPPVDHDVLPWVEPGLPAALASLTVTQRTVILLVDGQDWTLSEVAEALGLSKSSAQSHHDRGMRKLRRRLKVDA